MQILVAFTIAGKEDSNLTDQQLTQSIGGKKYKN